MKKLNKKGFFMTETLMVIVFVSLIFTFLYVSVIPLIGNYNDKVIRESDIDIVYKLYSVRKAINKDINKNTLMSGNYKNIKCNDFANENYCNQLMSDLELSDYSLIYTDNIGTLYENINSNTINVDKEIKDYLEDYKDNNTNAIILLDKNKHTVTHLNFIDPDMDLGDLLEYKIERIIRETKGACNPLYMDTDGIKYFSGTNECVDMNYVWYSGKLWRIVAIYPDGTIKMVTEDIISTIVYNPSGSIFFYNGESNKSYMYQWLNEDFYDSLENPELIIDNTKTWNATVLSSTNPIDVSQRIPETVLVRSNVGLLTSYEYYNSYRCISNSSCSGSSYSTGFLYNNYYWYYLNPYDSYFWYSSMSSSNLSRSGRGVRPAIYVKSNVDFTGDGTKERPYKLVGDKSSGKINDFLNTRMSGEYVMLKKGSNSQLFRIVDIEEGKTKLIATDLAANGEKKQFAMETSPESIYWGSGTTVEEGAWFQYLNNVYYPDLVNKYGDIFDSGTYYMGYGSSSNYKNSICASDTTESVKTCSKTSHVGSFKIGLSRYGELFATHQTKWNSSQIAVTLISPYDYDSVWTIGNNGHLYATSIILGPEGPTGYSAPGAYPTVHLKSSIKIKSGKGTKDNPYIVGL